MDAGDSKGPKTPPATHIAEGTEYWRIREWFPQLPEEAEHKLRLFQKDLIHFNGRMNLISPRTEQASDLIHIADGILGSNAVAKQLKVKEIFDLGSGNGVPGLIFALLNPARDVRLVEADGRKIEFLKLCITRMGMKNCTTVHARLEDLKSGIIHAAMSRGLASISKALLMARKCAAVGCQYYHFKGQSWSKELAEIPPQILASWEPNHVEDYKLPAGNADMSIVLTTRNHA
jgi:16S rRNA (guanine527-N7)-methyltransferase